MRDIDHHNGGNGGGGRRGPLQFFEEFAQKVFDQMYVLHKGFAEHALRVFGALSETDEAQASAIEDLRRRVEKLEAGFDVSQSVAPLRDHDK